MRSIRWQVSAFLSASVGTECWAAFVSGPLKQPSRLVRDETKTLSAPTVVSSRIIRNRGFLLFDANDDNASNSDIVWTSLASTEKWIQETLNLGGNNEKEQSPSSPRQPARFVASGDNQNPYTRKEVQYECEESTSLVGVMAGIFARLKSLRELGDAHCDEMQEISSALEGIEKKSKKFQSTLRQTIVLVAPSCPTLSTSFEVFDALVQVTNQARRDARDYVLDVKPVVADEEEEWVTSLNLSHLHPSFYYEKPGMEVAEEDPKVQLYKEQRRKARQSPYPTVVLEVKASPQQPLNRNTPNDMLKSSRAKPPATAAEEDVKKLEALFGKTAATSTADDPQQVDAAAMAVEKFATSIFSPIGQGQNWITEHDETYEEGTSSEVCPAIEVDAVWEFVFQYLHKASTEPPRQAQKAYFLLPHFCTKSATSFHKFTVQLATLLALLQFDTSTEANALQNIMVSDYFHPEHVDPEKRSPLPILSLSWGPKNSEDFDSEGAFQ